MICLLLVSRPSSGQTEGIDNLNPITWEAREKQHIDTNVINNYIEAAISTKYTNRNQTIALLDTALQWSRQSGYHFGYAWALMCLGVEYADRGQFSRALSLYRVALHHLEQNKLEKLQERMEAQLYLNLGTVFTEQELHDSALHYYYKTIETSPDGYIRMRTLLNIGASWERLEDPGKALSYFEKAVETGSGRTEHFVLELLGHAYINMAAMYNHRKQYLRARQMLLKAADISELDDLAVTVFNNAMGTTYLYHQQAQPQTAIPYFEKALTYTNIYPRYSVVDPNMGLGASYFALKDYRQAEQHYLTALETARQLSLPKLILDIYANMAALYAAMDHTDKAYQYQKTYSDLRDSMADQEREKIIHQLETRYRLTEKEREFERILSRKQGQIREKNVWIISVTTALLLLTALLIVIYRSNKQKQKLLQAKITNTEKEREIELLKAMIKGEEQERGRIARELHDGIGGMLAAIKMNFGSARKDYPELRAIEQLDSMSHLLQATSAEIRKTAHNLMPDILTRHSLQKALETFCENINAGGLLYVSLQFHKLSATIDKAAELMLYRIIQELVQNIIKHAHATQTEIQIMEYDGKLSITVEDNGIGFDTEVQYGGFGLQNLKFRVQALQGYLSITSVKEKSTTVHIEFSLEKLKLADMSFGTSNNITL